MIRAGLATSLAAVPAREHPRALLALDFIKRRYRVGNVYYPALRNIPGFSFARSSTKYAHNRDGLAIPYASGELAFSDRGLSIEWSTQNLALYSRDMTNAVWTASNVTTAQDVTGLDGIANSATRLTSTAGNGTVLQAITAASLLYGYSVWLKRISGTGNIDLTLDNGATWTNKTLTSEWTQVAISQTLANPTVGIRIVTSGDVIAVDGNCCYIRVSNDTSATSLIATTSAAVTRAADVLSIRAPFAWLGTGGKVEAITLLAIVSAGQKGPNLQQFTHICVSTGATNDQIEIASSSSGTGFVNCSAGGSLQAGITFGSAMPEAPQTWRLAGSFEPNSFGGANAGTLATRDTSGSLPTGLDRINLGSGATGAAGHWYLERLVAFPFAMTDSQLVGLTKAVPLGWQ